MSRGKHKTTDIVLTQRPRHVDGLDINPVEDGFMIYRPDTDRVHYLNHTAVLILELSNGRNTPARIATPVLATFSMEGLSPEAAWAQAANCSNMTTSECCRFAAEITIAIAQLGAGCCSGGPAAPTEPTPTPPGFFFLPPEIQALLVGQLGKAQTLMAEGLDKGNGDCTNPPA